MAVIVQHGCKNSELSRVAAIAVLALLASGALDAVFAQTPNPDPSPAPEAYVPLSSIPLSSLAATRDRPLFSPSRRPPVVSEPPPAEPPAPPPVAAPPAAAAAEPPNLTLLGTVLGGKESFAIFADAATQDTLRMRKGETRQGWTLTSIDRRAAIFTNGDQVFTAEFPANSTPPEAADPPADDDSAPPPRLVAPGQTGLQPAPGSTPTHFRPPPSPNFPRRGS